MTPPGVTGAPRQPPPRPGAGRGHQVRQTSGCPPRPSPKIRRVVPVPAAAAKSWPYVPGREQLAVPAGAPGPRCPPAGEGRAGGGTAAALRGQSRRTGFSLRLPHALGSAKGQSRSAWLPPPGHRRPPLGATRGGHSRARRPWHLHKALGDGGVSQNQPTPLWSPVSPLQGGGPHPEEGVPPSAGSPAADQGHREGREGQEGPHVSPRSPPQRLRPARRSRKGHAVPEPARSPRFPPGSAAAPGPAGSGGCGTCHPGVTAVLVALDRTSPLSPPSSPPRQDIPAVPAPYTGERHARGPRRYHPRSVPPAAATPGVFPRRCHPRAGSLATAPCYGERRGAPEGGGRCRLSARRSNTGDSGSVRRGGVSRASPPHAPASPPAGQASSLSPPGAPPASPLPQLPPTAAAPEGAEQASDTPEPGNTGEPPGNPSVVPPPLANPPGHPPASAPGASRERGDPPEPGDSRDSRKPQASPAPVAAPGAEGRWGSPPSRTPHKFTHLPPTPGLRCPRALPPLTMARWRRHVRRRARDPSGSRWHNQGPGASLDSGSAVPPSPSLPRRASVSPARRRRPRGLRAAMRRRYDAAPHAQPRAPAPPPLGASRGFPGPPGSSRRLRAAAADKSRRLTGSPPRAPPQPRGRGRSPTRGSPPTPVTSGRPPGAALPGDGAGGIPGLRDTALRDSPKSHGK
ncbi:basic proline-rich protein-like [Melospiza georgiana]|uniref:basic proline-rich protein-like n=1 Tax=Melospiza georgiana TaxID=44398 RepID=UPI0025AD02F4|nr:basic proline-rich protein-like [Melospiza georgiana]